MNKSSFVFPSIAKLEEEIKREESKIIKDNDASPYIDREDYDFQKCKSTYTFKMKAKNVIKNRNLQLKMVNMNNSENEDPEKESFMEKRQRISISVNDQEEELEELQPFNRKNFFQHHKRYGKIIKSKAR